MNYRKGNTFQCLNILLILSILIANNACSSGIKPATATAQAQRARVMATQIALNLKATNVLLSKQVEATAQAVQDTLETVKQLPPAIIDSFDANTHDWFTGEDSDQSLATVTWMIEQGVYRWKASAIDGFVWWVTPEMEDVTDFYFAAQVHQLYGPKDGECGLIFRKSSDSDYYLFEIDDQRQFAVYFHNQDGWEPLLDWQEADAIQLGLANRLSLIARGPEFLFFINDQNVASLVDTRLSSGKTGLLVGLMNAGEEAGWEFDNFELRVIQAGIF